jgi:hypothetical protein
VSAIFLAKYLKEQDSNVQEVDDVVNKFDDKQSDEILDEC